MSKLAWYVAILFGIDMAIYLVRFIVVVARGARTESRDRGSGGAAADRTAAAEEKRME